MLGMLVEAMMVRPFSLFLFCRSAKPTGTSGPWGGWSCVTGAVVGCEEGGSRGL